MHRLPSPTLLCFCFLQLLLAPSPGRGEEWHHPLYRDGGGWWDARIPVEIENLSEIPAAGVPLALEIARDSHLAQLTGQAAESVRLCNAEGAELRFRLLDPQGSEVRRGPIPPDSRLVVPVECAANGKSMYFVYFDNPRAGELADFLSVRTDIVNGGVELGTGSAPTGWQHDRPDADHRASWVSDMARAGTRSLKTVVSEGAEPSWVATRQHGIAISGGARYAVRGWLRGENVAGDAGLYCHVGNAEKPMMLAPSGKAGEGTFDWKEVRIEFTAPNEADTLSLGTMLHGSGTAWFDDISLERLDKGDSPRFKASPLPCRRLGITRPDASPEWLDSKRFGPGDWNYRATLTAATLSDVADADSLLYVNTAPLTARFAREVNLDSLRVTCDGIPVPFFRLEDSVLIAADIPPRTAKTLCLYYSDDPNATTQEGTDYADLLHSRYNLVKNPSFESGGASPDDWKPAGPVQDGMLAKEQTSSAGLGESCVRLTVPSGTPPGWRGWTQSLPVSPDTFYLLSGYVQSSDLKGVRPAEFDPQAETPTGYASIHVHFHTADGGLCTEDAFSSIGPPVQGTADWTLLSNVFRTQPDAASLSLHLTMESTGTLRHDGILAARVRPCAVSPVLEFRGGDSAPPIAVWPVNAIRKVFQEDFAPPVPQSARITLARNEKEPLQLAVRAKKDVSEVSVECSPLAGPDGAILDDIEIAVVGYVPVDYPTGYYQSRSPSWHLKHPTKPSICDGWPGMWPDPLLPADTFPLKADRTQPVWITFGASRETPAGEYRGTVTLSHDGTTLAAVPVTVRVWNFKLPDENHVKAVYDVRLGPAGTEPWNGENQEEIYRNLRRFMASRRLCADTVTPAPRIEYQDGRAVCDFSEFDAAAEVYFGELGMKHTYTPWQFYLFGWGHPPGKKFGEPPYPGEFPYENADRSQLRPEFKKAYQTCLKAFWDHVKDKGWSDRFLLYISDEPFFTEEPIRAQMKALCEMIHEVDPDIPIYSSTWHHVPAWNGSLDVWGIGHYGIVSPEVMAQRRASGDRIWFTTDGQMCTDTPYCAVERLLPHYCFMYGAEAYEFWGVSWLTYDPYRYGWHSYIHQSSAPGDEYYVRYPNGDGFLIYPGKPIGHAGPVSSIRLEQAREGVEDYEYLYLLRQLLNRDPSNAEAKAALAEAAKLVPIPNAGGRYSSKVLADPDVVLRLKEQVATALENGRE